MSKRNLSLLLQKIETDTKNELQARGLINRTKHIYELDLNDTISEIRNQIVGTFVKSKKSLRYELGPEQLKYIERKTKTYFDSVKNALINYSSRSNVAGFKIKPLESTSSRLVVEISGLSKNSNVFGLINRLRKGPLDILRQDLLIYLKSQLEGESTLEERILGNYNPNTGTRGGGLLQLGHLKGVSIAEQRGSSYLNSIELKAKNLRKKGGYTENNPLIRLNMKLHSSTTLRDLKSMQVEAVVVKEQGQKSNAEQAKYERSLLTTIRKSIESSINNEDWVNFESSPSAADILIGNIHAAAKKAGATKYSKSKVKNLDKGNVRYSLQSTIRDTSSVNKLQDGNLDITILTSQGSKTKGQNWFNIIPIINSKLNAAIVANMRYPRLVNRTGTFASSVQITGVEETKGGFPSFVYTYQRDPYDVFDSTLGASPWNTPERDPKDLINVSIRQIMRDLAIGRFYLRRA